MDLAVITDDGLTLHETIACKIPVVVVIGVKYGRYHGLSKIFEGAIIESNVDNITYNINKALNDYSSMKRAVSNYSRDILESSEKIIDFISSHII